MNNFVNNLAAMPLSPYFFSSLLFLRTCANSPQTLLDHKYALKMYVYPFIE